MVFTLLPHLNPHDRNTVIQVQVARKWEFRGGTDTDPLQHIDMVLPDHEVNKQLNYFLLFPSFYSYTALQIQVLNWFNDQF
jgi:hypothetical protein